MRLGTLLLFLTACSHAAAPPPACPGEELSDPPPCTAACTRVEALGCTDDAEVCLKICLSADSEPFADCLITATSCDDVSSCDD